MDIIIDWQEYKTTFNDTDVKMLLRPLTRRGFMLLLPHMQAFEVLKTPDSTSDVETQAKVMKLQGVCRELFKDHLRDFEGFTINGKPPTIEQLTDESMFATLCMDIIAHLISISVLDRGQAKNSDGQSTSQNDSAAA